MFLYWPVVLVGVSIIIMFFPGPILYHRSREWWAYSNVSKMALIGLLYRLKPSKFRLLLAGLYPVEFRDFFLGDMYCSLTYAMGVGYLSPMNMIRQLNAYLVIEPFIVFLSLCPRLGRSNSMQFDTL